MPLSVGVTAAPSSAAQHSHSGGGGHLVTEGQRRWSRATGAEPVYRADSQNPDAGTDKA